jgi:inner membrane protein
MLREGHLGLGLLVYLPFAGVLALLELWVLFGIGVAATIIGAGLPDLDTKILFVKHRGWTHTVWFMVAVGIGGLIVGGLSLQWLFEYFPLVSDLVSTTVGVAAVGVFAGGLVVGVGSHLLGDLVTREGLCPFHPVLPRGCGGLAVSDSRYHWGSLRAKNRVVNAVFLTAGLAGLSGVVFLGTNL